MALGFLVLGTQVILPLVFFKTQDEVAKPFRSSVLGVATGFNDFEFNELEESAGIIDKSQNIPEFFYISIPKLQIEDALVETNSKNLSPETSLGHYNGSSLPGKPGNAFIYGHSVLPWFFNPNNYRTIFSTLGDLNKGDEIKIDYNNRVLTYKVESKEILSPDLVKPLENWKPKFLNESTLTLMTCWPAGTRTKRLLVKAILVD
jgi:LPXTG-site transpeptidase (sortase) family protein